MTLGRSKPKTLEDRARAAAGDAMKAVDDARKAVDDARRAAEDVFHSTRTRALALAGAAVGAAGVFAFWRSRHDTGPSVHVDPAQPQEPAPAKPTAAHAATPTPTPPVPPVGA